MQFSSTFHYLKAPKDQNTNIPEHLRLNSWPNLIECAPLWGKFFAHRRPLPVWRGGGTGTQRGRNIAKRVAQEQQSHEVSTRRILVTLFLPRIPPRDLNLACSDIEDRKRASIRKKDYLTTTRYDLCKLCDFPCFITAKKELTNCSNYQRQTMFFLSSILHVVHD